MTRYLPLAVLLLLAACAQVRELQGGEKDITAPVLLASDPPNGSVHFASDRIVLRFNERVKLDRVRERLLISPPLERAPDVLVNAGREVVIDLKSPLAPNTTYTFNIGEAVVDITEGNPAAGLTYVVSTGEVLDSLQMTGVLVEAFTDKPEADAYVILHADTDSAGFRTGRPAYFTRTDKEGRFSLQHLREGRYQLHALRDQNANFRYDLPNEQIAFTNTLVATTDSLRHLLRLFREQAPVQQVLEAMVQPDRCWRMVLARPAERLDLRALDRVGGTLSWVQEWNPRRDTVFFWPSDTTLLAGQRFVVADTSGTIDTLTYRVQRKMPYLLNVKGAGRTQDGQPVFLASRPVDRIDNSRISLRIDTLVFPAVLVADTSAPRRVLMDSAVPEGRSGTLLLLPGALRDIYDGENDTLRLSIGSRTAEQAGDLKLNIMADSLSPITGPFILQVLNAQGGVVRTERFASLPYRAELPGTAAGVYTLKLIADGDGDGRWSTGSLKDRRQPERVFRQAGDVNVRAGWEVAVDWVVQDH